MKLNLGCGEKKYDGFINVDKFGTPDLKCDLEKFPWLVILKNVMNKFFYLTKEYFSNWLGGSEAPVEKCSVVFLSFFKEPTPNLK